MNHNVITLLKSPEVPAVKAGKYEIHFHDSMDGDKIVPGAMQLAEGFLKFGPQFIAVLEGPEDVSTVTFAVGTHVVKYIKRVSEDDAVQATLSL
jgi:hypothetical protein